MVVAPDFTPLLHFLERVPAIKLPIASGTFGDGLWWVKFPIDIEHLLAWQVVQELAHVMNYLSTQEPLPTIFKPVSPPAYMNGGPKDFLSWVIESTAREFQPSQCAEWLIGRMPSPVEDRTAWELTEE